MVICVTLVNMEMETVQTPRVVLNVGVLLHSSEVAVLVIGWFQSY